MTSTHTNLPQMPSCQSPAQTCGNSFLQQLACIYNLITQWHKITAHHAASKSCHWPVECIYITTTQVYSLSQHSHPSLYLEKARKPLIKSVCVRVFVQRLFIEIDVGSNVVASYCIESGSESSHMYCIHLRIKVCNPSDHDYRCQNVYLMMIVEMTLKYELLGACFWFLLKMLTVTLIEVKLIRLVYVGLVFNRCIHTLDKNLPNPRITVSVTFKSFIMWNFQWSYWPWKQGQTYDMQLKVLSLSSLGINIKSVP